MVKKLQLIVLLVLGLSVSILAQDVVLSDQFDNGDGKWNSGWINTGGGADVAFSIDTTGVLSGKNSYLADITSATDVTYNIQRVADCPLLAGNQYTVSFMAVADQDSASLNVLFELAGDPYTKRLNEIVTVDTTVQVYTFKVSATEDVPTNQLKIHYGGTQNDNTKIWIDSVIVTKETDPALISEWGEDGLGYAWTVTNDTSTAPGDAGIAGTQPMASNGSSIYGGFDSLKATTEQAVVVSGQLEFVGSPGPSYTALRFALTYRDSMTLHDQYTDSARWVGADSSSYFGYEFTPRSGSGVQPNGGGGNGSVWTIIDGNWPSTYSNGGGPIGPVVNQAPRNAEISAGTYNWAISVIAIDDTTNEIRWSLYKTDSKYWFAGTVIDTAVTTKFNGIGFWTKEGEQTELNIMGARAALGNPITIPEAPWEPYYIDLWGEDDLGYAWDVLNDTNTVVGTGIIAGTQPMASNGSSIYGGFGQDVNIPADGAVIVSGELEFVGSPGDSYTALRFAIAYRDSMTLQDQYTDSARWVGADSSSYFGYEFTPRSGSGVQPNGGGGNGSVWTIIDGNWPSTYSNGGGPVGPVVNQAPRNAEILEGTYEWAISVNQVNDSTNEVRWKLVKSDNKYWFAGTVMAPAVSDKFNGVGFWTKDGEHTQLEITYCEVDLGDPITIPERPWEDYYIDTWGFYGDLTGGWTNDTEDIVGQIKLSGENPPSDWSAVRGEFYLPVELSTAYSYNVEGTMTLTGGGFEDMGSLAMGLFYTDSAGTTWQDSLLDSSWVWTGSADHNSGYLFMPASGSNEGSFGGIVDGNWMDLDDENAYVLGENGPMDDAVAGAGEYDFQIGLMLLEDGTCDVRLHMEGPDGFVWEAHAIDDSDPLPTAMINSVCFAIKNSTTTGMDLQYVEVTRTDQPIVLDIASDVTNNIPTSYSLSQNYPNPFNPSTKIKFGLPKQSDVKLVVYDVLGRVVAEVANKKMSAGFHEVTFSASRFASGIYFYRIKAGDFVSVKKMMLLK